MLIRRRARREHWRDSLAEGRGSGAPPAGAGGISLAVPATAWTDAKTRAKGAASMIGVALASFLPESSAGLR